MQEAVNWDTEQENMEISNGNMVIPRQFFSLPDTSSEGSHLYCGVEYMSALAGPFSKGSVGWMVW